MLFLCSVLPGVLFDIYESYSISFYVGGASLLFSGLVIMSLAVSISERCRR